MTTIHVDNQNGFETLWEGDGTHIQIGGELIALTTADDPDGQILIIKDDKHDEGVVLYRKVENGASGIA